MCYQFLLLLTFRPLVDKNCGLPQQTIYQLQHPPDKVSKNCEKSKDNDDVDVEHRHDPATVSKATKRSPLGNEDRSIPVYHAAISKPFVRDLKQSLMTDVRRSFNNADPDQLQQLSFNELQSLTVAISLESTPGGKKSIPDLKPDLKDYFRGRQRQYINCLPLGGKQPPTDSDPKFASSAVTVSDKPSDPLPWPDPTKSPPVDQLGGVWKGLPPAIAQEGSVSWEEDTTKDSCEGRTPTGGEAEDAGNDAQKSSSCSQDRECSPSPDSSDTSVKLSLNNFDDDANSQGQGVLPIIFGSLSSRARSLWSLLLRVVFLLLLVPSMTCNSNHSLAVYSSHDLVLSTVSDLSCLPVCPTHQLNYSISFLIQLHMKHKEKLPDSTETLAKSSSLTRCLKQFPSLNLPVCALNSESTEMATCLLTEIPKVPLCSTPPSVPTKSSHTDIQTDVQEEIKEFTWGNFSETKAIVPTAQSVERNIHSGKDSLLWHTQYYEAYPEMEMQCANGSYILTVFLPILCMSSLRSKPKRHTTVATSQQNKHRSLSARSRRLISADLPPDKPPQGSGYSSAESEVEPDSRSVACDPGEEVRIAHSKPDAGPVRDGVTPDAGPVRDCVTPHADPVRDSVTPAATSETAVTEETSALLPPSTSNDVIEGIDYLNSYYSKDDDEQDSHHIRKQWSRESSGFVSNGSTSSSSLLDPSEERLSLTSTDPISKTPDHTQEQTDGGGGGSGSGSGTSCAGASGGGNGNRNGAGGDGGGGGDSGSGHGQGAGGSGDDGGRDDRDRLRRDGNLHPPADDENPRPKTPEKVKVENSHPPDDQQSPDSGYKTKPSSTSSTLDRTKPSSMPKTNCSSHVIQTDPKTDSQPVTHSTAYVPHLLNPCEAQQTSASESSSTFGLDSALQQDKSSTLTPPTELHPHSPIDGKLPQAGQFEPCKGSKCEDGESGGKLGTDAVEHAAHEQLATEESQQQYGASEVVSSHLQPRLELAEDQPPLSNSQDVPVPATAASPEHSAQEELRIPTEESWKQNGASEMVCSLLQRPLDCAGNDPMSSGGCTLETQGHQKLPYWKLIDGTSLVLETPGDDYFPPETPDDDDPSQGQERPPRRHHNPPPPFLISSPHEEVPVAPSTAVAMDDQVCVSAYVLRTSVRLWIVKGGGVVCGCDAKECTLCVQFHL